MEFEDFRNVVVNAVGIISADLEKLRFIAEQGNEVTNSSTTFLKTTQRPEDMIDNQVDVSRCTIPIAMVCFSAIDMFGQWVKEGNNDDFGNSATAFFEKLAKRDDLKNTDSQDKFKDQFRCGVMHSFFAMQGFDLAYPDFDGNTLFIKFRADRCTLDVRYLMSIVKQGMKNLVNIVSDEKSFFAVRYYSGYQRWLAKR